MKKRKRRPMIAISHYAHNGYFQAVKNAGGEVFEVFEKTKLKDIDCCDGLLIPGGRDVGPYWYGEQPHLKTQISDFDRDCFELALIKRALNNDQNILGVCRGHQLLNVAMGGSLHQHITNHEGFHHKAFFFGNRRCLRFVDDEIEVNSLHHQAVADLGDGLQIVAISPDGTIEAIESKHHNWVVGVQFHPEMMQREAVMRQIVRAFVNG